MIAVYKKPRQPKGNVFVRVHRVGPVWIWTVVYRGVPFIFDAWGISRSMSSAINRTMSKVQKIVRYENGEV